MVSKLKSKRKNPLYVIKKDTVIPTNSTIDYLVKKFGMGPVVQFLESFMKTIFVYVKDYPTFLAVKKMIDSLIINLEILANNTWVFLRKKWDSGRVSFFNGNAF
jgi:hypothetical protein